MSLEVTIASSQNWDPTLAIEEIFNKSQKNFEKLSFILLFSTTHYEKNSGFQKMLDTIYTKISFDVPLIGCSVPGFITAKECNTRGVTAFFCFSDELKIIPCVGLNSKRNPKDAAKNFISMIKNKIDKNYKKSILIEFISGPTIPSFPIVNKLNLIKSKILGEVVSNLLPLSAYLGFGIAKDDTILSIIDKELPELYIIGGSAIDDGKLTRNYLFYQKEVKKNAIVGLVIQTNNEVITDGFLEMKTTGKSFKATKISNDGTVLKEIDQKPAADVFLSKVGLDRIAFNDQHRLYRTTLYYPIGFTDKINSSTAIGAIYGQNILLGHQIVGKECYVLSSSGKYIFETPKKMEPEIIGTKKFMFVSACETGLETLGRKIMNQQENIIHATHNTPFLVVFFGGEHYKLPNENSNIRTHSFNFLTM